MPLQQRILLNPLYRYNVFVIFLYCKKLNKSNIEFIYNFLFNNREMKKLILV